MKGSRGIYGHLLIAESGVELPSGEDGNSSARCEMGWSGLATTHEIWERKLNAHLDSCRGLLSRIRNKIKLVPRSRDPFECQRKGDMLANELEDSTWTDRRHCRPLSGPKYHCPDIYTLCCTVYTVYTVCILYYSLQSRIVVPQR